MNNAQIIGYPLLIIAALELFLGLLILRKNPRSSPVNRSTAACAFAAAAWSFSAALMYIRFSQGLDHIIFARLSWLGWFTVPAALQTILYLGDEQSRKARNVGLILYPFWAAVLALCLFTDLIVTDGYVPLPYRNSPGPVEMPVRIIGSLMAFWLIFEIVRLRRRVTGRRRSQLSHYLYGTIIFGVGGAVIGGVIQVFTGVRVEPSLSAFFSLPWILSIFYAIRRYRLFDIRLILSRTIAILLLSFCISALQFLLFRLLEPVVGAIASIFISVPIIGVLFFGTPLSRNVQRWINELVLGDRYLYQKMLRRSANAMITILDRDELLRYIIESVRTFIGVREASLYVRGTDGTYSTRHCGVNQNTDGGCVLPHAIVSHLVSRNTPIVTDELSSAGVAGSRDLVESILQVGSEVVLPLASKGQLLGVLTLGQRTNGVPYMPSDIETLQALANHAAVAIENAQLFEDAIQARASQRESEHIFRILAETTSAAIFIVRGERTIYANRASVLMTGYSIDDLLAINPWSMVHPEFRSSMIERSRSLLAGREVPPQFEFKFITKQGEERWAVTMSAAIELQGAPALLATILDVTDIKRTEEERERLYEMNEKHYRERIAEQERFSAVLSTTSDGFWIVNRDNRLEFVNDAYCRMSGYGREELLAMSIADLEALESPEIVRRHTDDIREKGHDRFETRHRRKDGSLVDLEVSVNSFRREGTVFAFLRDISERKRDEMERARLYDENEKYLRDRIAEQKRFAAVLDTTNDGFWICGEDVRFTYVNDAYCRMLGYRRDELLSMSIKDVEMNEDAGMIDVRTRKIAQVGHDIFETRHRRKDGSLLDLEITVNYFAKESLLFSFGRDITERKKAEAEKARYQAEREKILKDLHDGIGGLTTNINLLAEIAQTRDDLGEVRRSLATIAGLSRESLSEIRSFLQSLDVKDLTWQAVAAELRHLASTMIEPHDIRFSLTTSLPENGNGPNSMMAMNLFRIYKESLINVVKHSRASEVVARLSLNDGKVVLEVKDNGVGVRAKRGTGRGLLNMQTRAAEMAGKVTVTSKKGTSVLLEIPLA